MVDIVLGLFGLLEKSREQDGPREQARPREWAARREQAGPLEWAARREQAGPREWAAQRKQAARHVAHVSARLGLGSARQRIGLALDLDGTGRFSLGLE